MRSEEAGDGSWIDEDGYDIPDNLTNKINRIDKHDRVKKSKISTKSEYDDRYKVSKGRAKHGGSKRNYTKLPSGYKPPKNKKSGSVK